ncbi:hypothetical protein SAMN02910409_0437 [Prevotellaceae bacterium HUN156]|nr:hypothetical protein SAMN02910409_0437 [Prevotellaceae bacterium HUN156]
MEIVDSFDKIIRPGLWFVKSRQPIMDVSRFVYEFAVELGVSVTVHSSANKAIQNEVVELIKKSCIENASDELEREWLEQELMEYNTHDHFWYPPELNQYTSKGFFWSNEVQCVDDKWFMLPSCSHDIVLVDDLSALWWENETDKHKMLFDVEKEAKDRNKTVIVFVSPNDFMDF